MTYQKTLDYLFNALPMYQRVGHSAYKADLNNTLALCNRLDNPQNTFKSIHIAGTNGKGSTSHALASILQEAGYKVGLYTSPHLKSFTERIKINGNEIAEEAVVSFVQKHKSFLEEIQPSFFEMTVAMAFDHFAAEQVDYAVIEVGLGGRLDSTNVITPMLSLITNIGYDHMQFLGNTLPAIAREKAGIVKSGVPVVISESHPETKAVFEEVAHAQKAPIFFADQMLFVKERESKPEDVLSEYIVEDQEGEKAYQMDLRGNYQKKNLTGILVAVEVLHKEIPGLTEEVVKRGLSRIIANTGLKGRWQKLQERPLVYCDTGHNAEGIKMIVEQLKATPHQHLFMVLGMSNDKDISPVLSLLPQEASYTFCEAKLPRAMSAEVLREQAEAHGLKGRVIADVNEALDQVLEEAGENDLVFVGGSTFVVAELDNL
jgi:dihydrofolate synthase/folylpolyglutamate synthase